jgi:hypothetical protein
MVETETKWRSLHKLHWYGNVNGRSVNSRGSNTTRLMQRNLVIDDPFAFADSEPMGS